MCMQSIFIYICGLLHSSSSYIVTHFKNGLSIGVTHAYELSLYMYTKSIGVEMLLIVMPYGLSYKH